MADLAHTRLVLAPLQLGERRRLRSRARLPVRGPERVARERVLDVREDQLLVLLLVVDPELDQPSDLARQFSVRELALERVGDVAPVVEHLFGAGSGEKPSLRARVHGSQRVVVGVEEIAVLRVEGCVPRIDSGEHERFEVPAGVSEMPLRRARELDGLQALVFR